MIQSRCGVIHPEVARALARASAEARDIAGRTVSAGLLRHGAAGSPRMRWALAVGRGVRQYVVLGAGFDTFAYRKSFPELRVFEVDHPDTQANQTASGSPMPASTPRRR